MDSSGEMPLGRGAQAGRHEVVQAHAGRERVAVFRLSHSWRWSMLRQGKARHEHHVLSGMAAHRGKSASSPVRRTWRENWNPNCRSCLGIPWETTRLAITRSRTWLANKRTSSRPRWRWSQAKRSGTSSAGGDGLNSEQS